MFTRDTALRRYSIPKVAKNYFVSSPLYWLIRINFLEADGKIVHEEAPIHFAA